jgi:hypothetical protein
MAEILPQVPWNSMDGRSPFSSLNPSHFSANVLPQTIRVEHRDSNARLFPCARIMPHPGPAAKRFLSPRGIAAATPSRVSCGMIPGCALFLRRVARVLALQPGSLIRCCFHHPWERHCCVSSEWYGTILPNGALSSPELRPCERPPPESRFPPLLHHNELPPPRSLDILRTGQYCHLHSAVVSVGVNLVGPPVPGLEWSSPGPGCPLRSCQNSFSIRSLA